MASVPNQVEPDPNGVVQFDDFGSGIAQLADGVEQDTVADPVVGIRDLHPDAGTFGLRRAGEDGQFFAPFSAFSRARRWLSAPDCSPALVRSSSAISPSSAATPHRARRAARSSPRRAVVYVSSPALMRICMTPAIPTTNKIKPQRPALVGVQECAPQTAAPVAG